MQPRDLSETVRIDFESRGRWGNPEHLYLKDFTAGHLNAIVTSRPEEILEVICKCLQDCVADPTDFDITELTLDEWYEAMLGMKVQFDSPVFEYEWQCECQEGEDNPKTSMMMLNLSEVGTRSIEDVDEETREALKTYMQSLDGDAGDEWARKRWPDGDYEKGINEFIVEEPFWFGYGEVMYGYCLPRIRDIIRSFQYSARVYDNQIQKIKKNKAIKEDLERKKAGLALEYSQALCLTKKRVGDKIEDVKEKDRLAIHRSLPSSLLTKLLKTYHAMSCGVNHSFDRKCEHCKTTERRWLRQDVSVFDFLTFIRDSKPDSEGESSESAIPHVLFGI